jgi:hypothetical protein
MIRNKAAFIASIGILCMCMYMYFPFPNNEMLDVRTTFTFMSFPIYQDGYIMLGVIGSVLFIIAMMLLFFSVNKYHFRTLGVALVIYTLLPNLLITTYQETLANGIMAISYDGNGTCDFEDVNKDILNGEASLNIHNRSNEDVTFELEFLDSIFYYHDERLESLMNLNGPYKITIEANNKETIQLKEMLDVSDVPKHITGGTSNNIHFILTDGETKRIF